MSAHWRLLSCCRPSCSLPPAPAIVQLASADDMRQARDWIRAWAQVHPDELPKDAIAISYSRSSGPGGQNVNKVSTKATVRLSLSRAQSAWLPSYVLTSLATTSPYYLPSPPSLLVSSSAHRTQPLNLADSLAKLHKAILDAAKQGLVGETSEGQKRRVVGLEAKEKRKMEGVKRERKDVKSGRRAGSGSKGGWD